VEQERPVTCISFENFIPFSWRSSNNELAMVFFELHRRLRLLLVPMCFSVSVFKKQAQASM